MQYSSLSHTPALRASALAALVSALSACGGDATKVITAPAMPGEGSTPPDDGAPDPGDGPEQAAAYILSSLVFSDEGTTGYISVLDSLDSQTIDNVNAREFAGAADVWVHDGAVFVTNDESFTITKFSVEGGQLVQQGVVSFASYGLASFGFWLNTFVSADKAYFSNGTLEYIVWNPSDMTITGNLPLPEAEPRDTFRLFTSYSDRAAVLKDGLLYQPFYWTDESYFLYAPDSRIVVIDVATDSVVNVIDAPCPGIDYATMDASGNIYFSPWVYAAGGAAVLDQPPTCVFELPANGEPHVAFDFPTLTGGHQGAAMRVVSEGRALVSVLHDERFPPSDTPSAAELTFANNWRFWSYDFATGTASPVEAIDWNGGAQYSFDIDGKTYMLVAASDYTTTTIYDLGDGLSLARAFDTPGWATRLFRAK
ncbi:MAG TPA: hypothetical protein VMG12_39280 [Polyangiaceae bacterium]|nr:hypothetical protein [Polyangiaceae bacterium]